MKQNTIQYLIFSAFFAILLSAGVAPVQVASAYTWNNRSFDTIEEMTTYIQAYMVAWRSVYSDTSPVSTPVVAPTASSRASETTTAVGTSLVHVSTGRTTSIEDDRATLEGKVDLNKESHVYVWFQYWHAKSTAAATTTAMRLTNNNDDDFDERVVSLLPETTYSYRAVAQDAVGRIDYGSIRQFTTTVDFDNDDADIRVTTGTATDIEDDRATLRSSFIWRKTDYAYVWFEYGETADDLDSTTRAVLFQKNEARRLEQTVPGLRELETYYFRVVAQDATGERDYGAVKSFKTKVFTENFVPDVSTNRADMITYYSALLRGEVDMNDSRNGIVFFVYGEDRTEVADVAKRYTRFSRIREQGDDLQKMLLDVDLDREDVYAEHAAYIDPSTRYYFAIGVEYEDENEDDRIKLGTIRSFTTKRQP